MELYLPEHPLLPGSTLAGTVQPPAGRCEAVVVRAWWAARGPHPDTDEIVVAQEQTLATGLLLKDTRLPFTLTLPAEPISHDGALVSVEWAITARIRWPGDQADAVVKRPITLSSGPLPDRAAAAAAWEKRWRKHRAVPWTDRLLAALKKRPMRLSAAVVSPGEVVALAYEGEDVAHRWQLVRIEEAAWREVREHPRTGRTVVTRWRHHTDTLAEGRIPLRGEAGARQAAITVPADAVASLLLPTRRIRWEIRVSTTGQDAVVPLVVLPG